MIHGLDPWSLFFLAREVVCSVADETLSFAGLCLQSFRTI